MSPASAPSARSDAAIAQLGNGSAFLFGGFASGGTVAGDLWSFNGNAWTLLNPSGTTPSARYGATMGYDGAGRLILFGGRNAAGTYLSDTWSFNGLQWQQLSTTSVAGARAFAAMALDVLPDLGAGVRNELILAGGLLPSGGGTPATTVLRFTGASWSVVPGVTYTPPTAFASAATDTQRDTVLLSDAFVGDATVCGSTFTSFGAGCGCILQLNGGATPPRIGTSIALTLAGSPNTPFVLLFDAIAQPTGIALPSPLFPVGCSRWVGIDAGTAGAELLNPSNPMGQASFSAALANSTTLLGIRVNFQALDLTGCASNALETRICR